MVAQLVQETATEVYRGECAAWVLEATLQACVGPFLREVATDALHGLRLADAV